MDAVQQGTVQVGQSTSYYYTGKNQALAFDAGVPFGMTARQQDAWLNEGGGLDVVRGVFRTSASSRSRAGTRVVRWAGGSVAR